MKIATIFGTRPEIIKLSPLIQLFDRDFNHILIHTGQHYSYTLDKIFFEDLKLRDCDYVLNTGSGTHGQQTGRMLMKLEQVLIEEQPDVVVVQGDTNSTLSGAIAASKLKIPLVHVEAGCRSFDKKMPEELNRIMVDHISDYLFAPDENAYNNLINEGIPHNQIYLVGNTSVDACLRAKKIFNMETTDDSFKEEDFALLTLHRQENTSYSGLKEILNALNLISERIKILFPAHLRTIKVMKDNNMEISNNLIVTDPLGYKDFIGFLANSKFVMTDSGGIQEESAVLNVPCLILRDNTEWMVYVDAGKNKLIGTSYQEITDNVFDLLDDEAKLLDMKQIQIEIMNGASDKIVSIMSEVFSKKD